MEISPLRAATGIVRSARPTRATAGWKRAAGTAARPAMSMSSSPCRIELAPLALQNKRVDLRPAVPGQRRDAARSCRAIRKHLGAEIGFFSVLHTWNQKLQQNPHS